MRISENIKFGFEVYGVKTGICTNNPEFLETLTGNIRDFFPDGIELLDPAEDFECQYRLEFSGEDQLTFFIDGKMDVTTSGAHLETFPKYFLSVIRLRVAERAVGRVFLHAGAVVWRDLAIILPGGSFKGKTTLVAALVRSGAEYLSDEYAVLDKNGRIEPFAKPLSMRGHRVDYAQTDISFEKFGKKAPKDSYPVGMVLFTEFQAGAVWEPITLSTGQGMLEIVSHAIPIRYNPKFTLEVLNKTLNHAIIAKSQRCEAVEFAEKLLEFTDRQKKTLELRNLSID